MTPYATIDELVATFRQTIDEEGGIYARLETLLSDSAQEIASMLGFDFHRHPAVSTPPDPDDDVEVRIHEGSGRDRLCVHDGIVPGTLTLVEYRTTVTGDWEELEAEDWELEDPEKPGHPSFHVLLTGIGRSRWPRGRRLVRTTAAYGWPAIPDDAKLANIHRARQLAAWDATMPGGPLGPDELGQPVGPNRMPDTMWRLRYSYGAMELGLAQCDL